MKNYTFILLLILIIGCDCKPPSERGHDSYIKELNLKLVRIEGDTIKIGETILNRVEVIDNIPNRSAHYYIYDDEYCAKLTTDPGKATYQLYSSHLNYDNNNFAVVLCPYYKKRILHKENLHTKKDKKTRKLNNQLFSDSKELFKEDIAAAGKFGCIYYLQHIIEENDTRKLIIRQEENIINTDTSRFYYVEAAFFFHPFNSQVNALTVRIVGNSIEDFSDLEEHLNISSVPGAVNIGIEDIAYFRGSIIYASEYEFHDIE